jgi:hypothetical protein
MVGYAQKSISVPAVVKSALMKKYPQASKATWEKEKGNYEANWGGRSGEDNAVMFTPAGEFIEIVNAIKVSELPSNIAPYVKAHFHGAKINEAGKVTDAKGKQTYEAEIKGKDLIFDLNGKYLNIAIFFNKKGNSHHPGKKIHLHIHCGHLNIFSTLPCA